MTGCVSCNCPDWGVDGIACIGLRPRNIACRLYRRQHPEWAVMGEARLEKRVEVSAKQAADVARRLALDFGFADPDILVTTEPAAEWRAPTPMGKVFSVPGRRSQVPVWRLFETAAMAMMAEAGKLAGVEFVVVSDHVAAA